MTAENSFHGLSCRVISGYGSGLTHAWQVMASCVNAPVSVLLAMKKIINLQGFQYFISTINTITLASADLVYNSVTCQYFNTAFSAHIGNFEGILHLANGKDGSLENQLQYSFKMAKS